MKAVLYCRVDGPENSFSVDAVRGQEMHLLNYAKENHIDIAGIYLDIACSGRTLERPGLQAVIQTIEEGKADTILTINHDRLFRGRFPKELQGLPIIALNEQFRKQERGGTFHEL